MNKTVRVLVMLDYLQNQPKYATIDKLSKRFNCSTRAIKHYLKDLRESGKKVIKVRDGRFTFYRVAK